MPAQAGFVGWLYADPPTAGFQEADFYFNLTSGKWRWLSGGAWADTPGGGGGGAPHNVLDGSTHLDTRAFTVVNGALIFGKTVASVVKWDGLNPGAESEVLSIISGVPGYAKIADANVAAGAGILESKLTLNFATHAENHKARHVVGGADAFAKGDLLVAAARYLEDVTPDPASDRLRWWLVDAGSDIKYWDDQVTPVLQTLSRVGHVHAAADVTSGRFGMPRMPDGTSGQFLKAAGAGVDPAYAALVRADITDFAHKATHISGGSDAFVKADVLIARARYLEGIVDPASDSTRLWINSADLKFWDNQGTPVLQTVERQARRGAANGYGSLDASALQPLAEMTAHGASKHSGNVFPGANQDLGAFYQDVAQIAAPANPGAGVRRVYMDSTTGKLTVRTSAGASVSLEEQGGGGTPTDRSVRLRKSVTQAITGGAEGAVTWDTEDYDTDTMHDNAANTERITFTTAGKYLVIFAIRIGENKALRVKIRKNGVTVITQLEFANATTTGAIAATVHSFAAADYVECLITNISDTVTINIQTESVGQAVEQVGVGGGAIAAGTLLEKNQNQTDVSITATGDNQATLNLASVTGLSAVYYELVIEVAGAANALIEIAGNIESPGVDVLESFRYRFDATGAGDIFRTNVLIRGRDATPETGDYHLNFTTVTLGGGTCTVKARYLIGVSS